MTDRDAILHRIAHQIRGAAMSALPDWIWTLTIPRGLSYDVIVEPFEISSVLARPCVRGELTRIDLNLPDNSSTLSVLQDLLAMELEPFIIGRGKVTVQKSPEGLIVIAVDDGQNENIGHA